MQRALVRGFEQGPSGGKEEEEEEQLGHGAPFTAPGWTSPEYGDRVGCLCLPGYGGSTCERPLQTCSPGWDSFQGACYKHFSTRRSWEDAETQCRHYGGHLATILTPEEQDFINGLCGAFEYANGVGERQIQSGGKNQRKEIIKELPDTMN
nr:PREDICTED: brevican core protein-like [Struthio camelus australis]